MNHQDLSTLNEIVAEFDQSTPITHQAVQRWMETHDIEAMGALMSLLADDKHSQRIEPAVTFEEYFPFATRYYERNLLENPDGEWSDSRTTAGFDCSRMFIQLWEDRPAYDREITQLKSLFKRLCEEGNEEFRSNFVIAVLEHLFQTGEIADYFSDWQNNSLLDAAYTEARMLADMRHRRHERDTAGSPD